MIQKTYLVTITKKDEDTENTAEQVAQALQEEVRAGYFEDVQVELYNIKEIREERVCETCKGEGVVVHRIPVYSVEAPRAEVGDEEPCPVCKGEEENE